MAQTIQEGIRNVLSHYTHYAPTEKKPKLELSLKAVADLMEVLGEYGYKITKK